MASKKVYVVAPGYSFTVKGHIYSAGDVISPNVFADKKYFAKLVAEKKILYVDIATLSAMQRKKAMALYDIVDAESSVEAIEKEAEKVEADSSIEEKVETESIGTKKSTSKGGK